MLFEGNFFCEKLNQFGLYLKTKISRFQVNVEPSRVILPRIGDRCGTVRYTDISRDPEVIEVETYKKRKYESPQQQQQQQHRPHIAKRPSLDVDHDNDDNSLAVRIDKKILLILIIKIINIIKEALGAI